MTQEPQKIEKPRKLRRVPQYKLLGDIVTQALSAVGVTEEKVSKWLGKPCGCKERREKLNKLHQWAVGLFSREKETLETSKEKLSGIIGDVPPDVFPSGT